MKPSLTKRQFRLLAFLAAHPGQSTHELAMLAGHQQAYESHLRDRLFRLAERGLVKYIEVTSPHRGICLSRTWYVANPVEE